MTQIIASGGEVNIIDFIGDHECSKMAPSLFKENGEMRVAGTKTCLVKVVKEKTKVQSYPDLTQNEGKTAVIVDAMYVIRQWSFHKDDTYEAIAERYRRNLLKSVPEGTDIIHFCCDRYSPSSLKTLVQQQRYNRSKPGRQLEVKEQYKTPEPDEFFSVSSNKAQLLDFLCETWCKEEQINLSIGSTKSYIGGGFKDETRSVLITAGTVTNIADLESTQQEADTKVILHANVQRAAR